VRAGIRKRVQNVLSDSHFKEILVGSFWALLAQAGATLLALAVSIIVARFYGAEQLGILAIMQAVMTLAMIFTLAGTGTAILRLIPEHVTRYSTRSAFVLFRQIQSFVVATSIFVGIIIFVGADLIATSVFNKPELTIIFRLLSLAVVFRSSLELSTQAARGLRSIKAYSSLRLIAPFVMLVVLLILSPVRASPATAVHAQILAWVIAGLLGALFVYRLFQHKLSSDGSVKEVSLRELLKLSSPMMMTASVQFVIAQTGVLMLGIYGTEADVGFYAVAVKLATLTSFLLTAINSMSAPKFAELHSSDSIDDLFRVARNSTRLIFWSTIPILLTLIVAGREILALLFGSDFQVAYTALAILVGGQFINSVSGSNGIFMNMTGAQNAFRNILIVAATANVLICWALIPLLGMEGAAIAATSCYAIWNLGATLYIKRHYGRTILYIPFDRNGRGP
jgi:O-antigen/teichoic acid export membrane protein